MKNTTLLALAGLAIPVAAFADASDIRLRSEASISLSQAVLAAEKHQGGQAYEASIDDDSAQLAYEVSVAKDNKSYDVWVDAKTGKIINSREDIDD